MFDGILETFLSLKDGEIGAITGGSVGGVGLIAILAKCGPTIITLIKSFLSKEKKEKLSEAIGHAIEAAEKIKIEIDKGDEHKEPTRKAKSNKRSHSSTQSRDKG